MTATELKKLEEQLWEAATILRNSSGLKSNEYATPILGIIFLRFAETTYAKHEANINATYNAQKGKRNEKSLKEIAILQCGFYLPDEVRYDYLLRGEFKTHEIQTREALKNAMQLIEENNDMTDTLPFNEYDKLSSENIDDLLKKFSIIPNNIEIDIFGKIYEFFLGEFAIGEGQKGGEFFTPTAVVELMVHIIDPQSGRMLDPACGSGGMFVHSAQYIKKYYPQNTNNFVVYGIEKSSETRRLALMNTKINNVRVGKLIAENTFNAPESIFETPHQLTEQFDYVLANPPFNVKNVKLSTVENKTHFNYYGLPKNKSKGKNTEKDKELVPNANYLWISLFATALKKGGKAGLVMANSASDARDSEYQIRKQLIHQGIVEAMLTLSSNMFNTVTLPATLWFFNKPTQTPDTNNLQILFVDARNIYTQISRRQRNFTPQQIQNIALIFSLFRQQNHKYPQLIAQYQTEISQLTQQLHQTQNQTPANNKTAIDEHQNILKNLQKEIDNRQQSIEWLQTNFPNGTYQNVIGLCKAATLADLQEQDYSLNPGRYVGIVIEDDGLSPQQFETQMQQWHQQLNQLNTQAQLLEQTIQQNLQQLLNNQ